MPAGEEGADGPEATMEGRGRVTLPAHARSCMHAHTHQRTCGGTSRPGDSTDTFTQMQGHRDTRRGSLALLRGGAMDTDTGLFPAQRHKYMRTYFS